MARAARGTATPARAPGNCRRAKPHPKAPLSRVADRAQPIERSRSNAVTATSACGRGWRVVARSDDLSGPRERPPRSRPPRSTFCRFRHLRSDSENLLNIDFGLSQPRVRWPSRRRGAGLASAANHSTARVVPSACVPSAYVPSAYAGCVVLCHPRVDRNCCLFTSPRNEKRATRPSPIAYGLASRSSVHFRTQPPAALLLTH